VIGVEEVTKARAWMERRAPFLKLIGHTPLFAVRLFEEECPSCTIHAKAEWMNPGGSVKDRPVMFMVAHGLERGDFQGGRSILDSSSGNAGIAYAMMGAALDIPVTLVVPGNASLERKRRIRSHGAKLIETDPVLGYDEALRRAHLLAQEETQRFVLVDQYANEWNWRAHYETTAVEILEQTGGAISHFVSGVGTGGTLTGVGRRLKERDPKIRVVMVVPESFPGIEGLKPLEGENDIVPEIFDPSLVDERVRVSVEEAYEYCHRLARGGLFVGQSSGANLAVAHQIARREKGARIVTLFPDLGERYLSTGLWEPPPSSP